MSSSDKNHDDTVEAMSLLAERLLATTRCLLWSRTDETPEGWTDGEQYGRSMGFVWHPNPESLLLIATRHGTAFGDVAMELHGVTRSGHRVPARTEAEAIAIPIDQRIVPVVRLTEYLRFPSPDVDAAVADLGALIADLKKDPKSPLHPDSDFTAEFGCYRELHFRRFEDDELYAFIGMSRDEADPFLRAVFREPAYEFGMTLSQSPDASHEARLSLAREHQGHRFYRGSSGAPVCDPTGAIYGIVAGGSESSNELLVTALEPLRDDLLAAVDR